LNVKRTNVEENALHTSKEKETTLRREDGGAPVDVIKYDSPEIALIAFQVLSIAQLEDCQSASLFDDNPIFRNRRMTPHC
jgi:hypothetical protein